jgi:hypothetical protein
MCCFDLHSGLLEIRADNGQPTTTLLNNSQTATDGKGHMAEYMLGQLRKRSLEKKSRFF